MIKITKVVLSIIGVLCLFSINTNINTVEASTYEIIDLEKLKEKIIELNQIPNNEDGTEIQEKIDLRSEIIENTSPDVLEKYHAILKDEVENLKFESSNTETINIYEPNNTENINTEELNLPESNAKIEITTENKLNNNIIRPRLGVSNGTHDYLVTYVIKAALYPDSKAVLTTTYNVTSKGLKAESCSKAGTSSPFPTSITSSCKITDSSATQIGHDINAQGDYLVTVIGTNGVGIFSYDLGIRSTIKWIGTQSSKLQTVETSYSVQKY